MLPEVEEVFLKFKKDEDKIESVLTRGFNRQPLVNSTNLQNVTPKLSTNEAQLRNRQILQELEVVKGNLRSKSIFSPMELQWNKLKENYQNNPSLPVQSWRCHLPIFV